MTDPQPLTDDESKAEVANRTPRCDHICRLDNGHVERGELHQYGYELPSPRIDAATVEQARRERDAAYAVIGRMLDGYQLVVDVWVPHYDGHIAPVSPAEVDAIRRAREETA